VGRFHALAGVVVLAGVFAACGGDDDSKSEGDSFADEASSLCIAQSEQLVDINLEMGYDQDEQETIEKVAAVAAVREETIAELKTLDPPADQAEDFDAYLAQRQETVDLAKPQLEALEAGDEEEIAAAGAKVQEASDNGQEMAAELGLTGCDSELPSDDAAAAEDVLREHLTTADPATSCNTDELVTETYLEEALGGVEACEKLQAKDVGLPTDIKVSKVEGTDGVSAFIDFEDVGGRFDGEPATAIVYYVDGWKVWSVSALE